MIRSTRYEALAAEVEREYSPAQADGRLTQWWKLHGRKWRNRVGYPRLTAEAALHESLGLVRSINRTLFRTRPAERDAYDRALEALNELTMLIGRENWHLFQGTEPTESESR